MDVIPVIRARYRVYLQSSGWRTRRNRALKEANYRCQRCGGKRGLEVHHKTYERLGAETDQDLEVLCHDCHEGHHVQQMHDSLDERVYLKLAREVQREGLFDSIADLSDALRERCAKLKIPYNAHQADRALEFVCGTTKFAPPPPQTRADVEAEMGRPLTLAESTETLHRLSELGIVIKEMPKTASRIDIYARVTEDFDDHDRY